MRKINKYRSQNVIAICLFVTVLIINSIFTLKQGSDGHKQQSLEQLKEYTVDMADSAKNLVEHDNQVILEIVANTLLAGEDYSPERLSQLVDNFPGSGMLSAIEIMMPDSKLYVGKGEVRTFDGFSFEEEVKKGQENLIRWYGEGYDTEVAYYRYPVYNEDEPVAIVYGIVELDYFAELLHKRWFHGESYIFMFDRDTREFLIDTMHKELKNNLALNEIEYRIGVEDNARIKKDFDNNQPGMCRAFSVLNQQWIYLSYASVGIENWIVMMAIPEKVLLDEHNTFMDSLFHFGIVTGLEGVCFLAWLLVSRKRRNAAWAEEMRREQEARGLLENIYNTMSSGLVRAYADYPYEVLMINPAGLKLFAVNNMQEFAKRRGNGQFIDTIVEEDAKELMRRGDELLQKQWDSFTMECHIRHDDGSVRVIEVVSTLIVAGDGEERPVLQRMCRDITKDLEMQRLKETQLQERYLNQMFSTLTSSTMDIYIVFSLEDSSVKFVSPNIESQLGIKKDEIYRNLRVLLDETKEKRILSFANSIPESNQPLYFGEVNRFNRITGEERWYQDKAYPTKLGNEKCVLVVLADRTTERQNRVALEATLENANAANRSKSSFLSDMSHDLRTPMNAIIGLVELLKTDIGKPEKAETHLEQITQSSRHMMDLVNNILDMSRIESGKMVLSMKPFYLRDVFSEVLDICKSQAQYKKQEVHETVALNNEMFIGDAIRIRMILINLVTNAVKYTHVGGTIMLSAKSKKPNRFGYARIEISIADNGVGMSEESMKELFNPYTREANTTMSGEVGTGLGLPIVKNLLDLMGGTITVNSKKNEGSKFTVELQLKTADVIPETPEEESKKQEEKPDELSMEGLRFLVVEDNEINAEVLMELLGVEKADSERAENGKKGVDMFMASKPGYYDAILMDVQMPIMNGYEATKAIRECDHPSAQSIPIIAMTANAFAEDISAALAAGMNVHLAKPVKMQTLKKNLKKLNIIS